MTRFFLTTVLSLTAASAAFAVVPPILPGVALPGVPTAKTEDADDLTTLADRIGKTAKGVGDKLGDADTGDATRRDQAQLKQDLDKLIDLLQNPPPPPMSNDQSQQPPPPDGGGGGGGGGGQSNQPMGRGQQQPMGGGMGQSQPQPRGGSQRTGGGRRDRSQQQPMPDKAGGQQPMPTGGKPDEKGQPMGAAGQPMNGTEAGGGGKATPTLPLAETIAKDFWGHLPELPRQRMMQFFREEYNSRYKDLLPDYFSTLAEKEKKGKP